LLVCESLRFCRGAELRLSLGSTLLVREVRLGSLQSALISGLSHTRRCSALLLQDIALKFPPLYPFAGATKGTGLDGVCR
tara:strand:- start:40 stop:279 length:240 start_codon:yes stop_codon:yes gene_type:complete